MSLSSSPFSHNHLTPLRASAETGFTPQPSLWQQVPLALTAWPLSNQHLPGFILLSPTLSLLSTLFLHSSIPRCQRLHPFSLPVYYLFTFPSHFLPLIPFSIMSSSSSIYSLLLEMTLWSPVDLNTVMWHQSAPITSYDSQCKLLVRTTACIPFKGVSLPLVFFRIRHFFSPFLVRHLWQNCTFLNVLLCMDSQIGQLRCECACDIRAWHTMSFNKK